MTGALPTSKPEHGGQLRQIAARFGVQAKQLLDFSASINPAGPPPSAHAAMRRALDDTATLTTYPDLELTELKQSIASCSEVQPANISVANGFVPLLDAALRSFRTKRCLLPIPSFNEYRRTLENANVTVIPLQLFEESSFRYDPDAIEKECLDGGCDAVLLANPQNPSGVLCAPEQMNQLVEIVARHNILVLLDEAFIDYCPDHSLAHFAAEQQRMIVFRSVTKFFALPGLRVAYAISNPSVTQQLNRFIAPWPITSFACNAVCAALLDEPYAEGSRRANHLQRARLERELAWLAISTYPSRANFLLLRFPDDADVDRLWERMVVDHQVVLRSCADFEGLTKKHLRIAVRSEAENARLIDGIKQALRNAPLSK